MKNTHFPVVLAIAWLFLFNPGFSFAADTQSNASKIVMMLNIVNKEYHEGIKDGQIINADEYGESQVFLSQARDRYLMITSAQPNASTGKIENQFEALAQAIKDKKNPKDIAKAIEIMNAGIVEKFGIKIEKIPTEPVSLENGKTVYKEYCSLCHGAKGKGDGPAAKGLEPAPAVLSDPAITGNAETVPYDNFQIINVGIANTAMRAWSEVLSERQIWDVTYYIRSFSNKDVNLPVFENETATASVKPASGALGTDEAIQGIRDLLTQSQTAYEKSDPTQARLSAMDAYLFYEKIEPAVVSKDKELGLGLERSFGDLQGLIKEEVSVGEYQKAVGSIEHRLGQAHKLLTEQMGFAGQFLNSMAIIVREGFEAILIIAALITFLVKSRNEDKVRVIWMGVGIGIVLSAITAYVLKGILNISSSSQEVVEAWIMLFAVVMLFWVSYWLLSKIEASKWQAYISGKMKEAVTTGSSMTLALVAFISVYREGFETILFYQALYIHAGDSTSGILPGFIAGSLILGGVYLLINKLGIRIPIKWFFGATSAFLYFMAFLFMGRGLHELQMGNALSMTPASWAPDIAWLGMYPTLETFFGQMMLVALFVFALFYTFVLKAGQAEATD